MNIISTRLHGILDYVVGLFIILSPWILGYYSGGYESWIPVTLGLCTMLYSLLTDYEFGLLNFISIKNHLALDLAAAVALIVSPWVIGFHQHVHLPHVIIGIIELLVALLTSHFTSYHVYDGSWRMDTSDDLQ